MRTDRGMSGPLRKSTTWDKVEQNVNGYPGYCIIVRIASALADGGADNTAPVVCVDLAAYAWPVGLCRVPRLSPQARRVRRDDAGARRGRARAR